ncbi:hypothetical protein [Rhizobium sp. SL86]|uniref:hypothetical protein n=1 Tax=Rhizobium sp. SL86 TaxID=2995148 RepID=UPI00227281F9|nr:hypothetical protein [Rhizobium sp. SL86]MCY1669360.1 hypothetical protein [Rhizobium sp. SL86]
MQALLLVYLVLWPLLLTEQRSEESHVTILAPTVGIISLAFLGLFLWCFPWLNNLPFRCFISFIYAIPIILRIVKKKRINFLIKTHLVLALAVFVQACIVGHNPLPVSQEYAPASEQPGRMIASPPDNQIPYITADYIRNGFDGREKAKDFFGEWGFTSRGLLVPFGINGLFFLLGYNGGGGTIASLYGWLTNSLVILGVFYLGCALSTDMRRVRLAIFWAALSPVIFINTVFTWPKLLAAYFLLLATTFVIRRQLHLAGLLAALAWLSHPVGALMIPALALFTLASTPLGAGSWIFRTTRFCLPAALTGASAMTPWILFKLHLGDPDPFATYLFGKGAGFEPAANFEEWIAPRIGNLYYTFTPFAFYNDGLMSVWLYGPLNDVSRWLSQYAKSLPGQLGFLTVIPAIPAILLHRWHRQSAIFLGCFLVVAVLAMMTFWGFSGDGLGRNSLEPVTIFLMVAICVFGRGLYIAGPILLVGAAAETITLSVLEFAADDKFSAQTSVHLGMLSILATTAVSAALLYSSAGIYKDKKAQTGS